MRHGSNYKSVSSFYKETYQPPQTSLRTREDFPEAEAEPVTESLQMTWEPVRSNNTAEPWVWGSAFWFTLHNGAIRYPLNASPIFADKMKGFILGIPYMLPCEKCSEHARAHIDHHYAKLDKIVSGREHLFKFFVDMHNMVNKRYEKPHMSVEDAYKLYSSKNVTIQKLAYKSA